MTIEFTDDEFVLFVAGYLGGMCGRYLPESFNVDRVEHSPRAAEGEQREPWFHIVFGSGLTVKVTLERVVR